MHRPREVLWNNDFFLSQARTGSPAPTSLNDVVVVELGPLKDVLLAHNVRVDEQVAVPHAEVLLTGRAFEALQMVNLVPDAHGHLKRSYPLLAGSAEAVLSKKPEEDINVNLHGRRNVQQKISMLWDHTPTWGSLSGTAFFPACSKASGRPPRVDSRTGRSSGSPRASTARWPSGRTCRRCSAGSHRTWAETEASAGPRPPAPCARKLVRDANARTGGKVGPNPWPTFPLQQPEEVSFTHIWIWRQLLWHHHHWSVHWGCPKTTNSSLNWSFSPLKCG